VEATGLKEICREHGGIWNRWKVEKIETDSLEIEGESQVK
jgi:hypothetical protein